MLAWLEYLDIFTQLGIVLADSGNSGLRDLNANLDVILFLLYM